MACQPDSQLRVKSGMEAKAAVAWATASRAHVNRDFRFNSQPLTAAFTEREIMGGVAWPNVRFSDSRFDYAFTLWSNSTLGLLLYWWHSNRQQSGRGRTTIRAVESLPVLDLRALSEEQRRTSETVFNELPGHKVEVRLPRGRRPPTVLFWTEEWSASSWASTRRPTKPCAAWPPNGALSRRCMAARHVPKGARAII